MYELLEDVPRGVTRVLSQSGRTNATLGIDGRWRRLDGQIVPLDAHGPWLPVAASRDSSPLGVVGSADGPPESGEAT